ncbi:MAG: GC-type dockerin domain-anchored protein [Phycisphaerales bacterium JB052]
MNSHFILCWLCTAVYTTAAAPIHWLSPVDGSWEDASSWAQGRVPGIPGDIPTLGLVGEYGVYSSSDATYQSLSIENPAAMLQIAGAKHSLSSDIANNGLIQIGDGVSLGDSSLTISGFNRFVGPGTIELNANGSLGSAQIDATLSIFTQEQDHSIVGSGELLVTLLVNNGRIEALGETGLRLIGTYSQSETGRIGAGAGTLYLTEDAAISGGSLYTQEHGLVLIEGGSVELENITIDAEIATTPGAHEVTLRGEIVNNGQLRLDATTDHLTRTLFLESGTSISGNGSVELLTDANASEAVLHIGANGTVHIAKEQEVRTSGEITGLSQSLLSLDGTISSVPGFPAPSVKCVIDGTGELIADQADFRFRNQSQMHGITLRSTDGGSFVFDPGTIRINQSTNEGLMRVDQGSTLIELRGGLVNNGQILLDAEAADGNVLISTLNELTISGHGSIELVSREGDSVSLASNLQSLTIGPDQLVFGHGEINGHINNGEVINQGTIRATDPIYPLILRGNHRGDGGAYIADNAQLELVYPVFLDTVTLSSVGSGEVIASYCTLKDCVVDSGTLRFVPANGEAILEGDMVNHAQMIVDPSTVLVLAGDSTLSGDGAINLMPDAELELGTYSDLAAPIIFSGQQIVGAGTIRGRASLDCPIIGNDPSQGLTVAGQLSFQGNEVRSDGASIVLDARTVLSGARLVGDRFVAGPLVELDGSINESVIDVLGDLTLHHGAKNDGVIRMRSSMSNEVYSILRLDPAEPLQGEGVIELENTIGHRHDSAQIRAVINQTGHIGSGQRVIGGGQIIGRVVIEGEMAPSGPRPEMQVMDLIFDENASFVVDLSGDTQNGNPRVTMLPAGNVELNGTLQITAAPEFAPLPGDSWQIVGSSTWKVPGSISGRFTAYEFPALPPGIRIVVEQENDSVLLTALCTADFNGDSNINFLDVSLFIQLFLSSDPMSDLNDDGQFNFFDVTEFVQAYAAGCPS